MKRLSEKLVVLTCILAAAFITFAESVIFTGRPLKENNFIEKRFSFFFSPFKESRVLLVSQPSPIENKSRDSPTIGTSDPPLVKSPDPPPNSGNASVSSPHASGKNYCLVPKRMTLRAIEREGIGYPKGYATLEMLFAPYSVPKVLVPMIDLRGHHLYNDTYAANAGLIGRFLSRPRCLIIGVNGYFDFRQGCMDDYYQLGGGFEVLAKRWDLRANVYFPLERKHKKNCFYEYTGGYFIDFRKKEVTYEGFNAEVGYYFVKSRDFFLYAGAGPYNLTKQFNMENWGGRVRLRSQFRDYLALELSASHDGIFHTIFQAEIIFSVPLYQFYPKKNRINHPCITDLQLYQPVQRFEIIPLKARSKIKKNF